MGGHPLVTKAHLLAGEAAGSVTEAEVGTLIHLSTTEGAAGGHLLGGQGREKGGERRRKISAMRYIFYISCPIVALSKCFSSIFLVDMALLWIKMLSQ